MVGAEYANGGEQRNNTRRNEEAQPKRKQGPGVDVSDSVSKVRCYKEQYCRETWNVRSMNQGKLDKVKREMARVNTAILGISELRRMRMNKFNSDDHCI